MNFKEARIIVELAGLLMVITPLFILGILSLKWHFEKKSK